MDEEHCANCGCELFDEGYWDDDGDGPYCEECAEEIGIFDVAELISRAA